MATLTRIQVRVAPHVELCSRERALLLPVTILDVNHGLAPLPSLTVPFDHDFTQ